MIETRGVVHFSIPVSDLDRSEAFYREILGLETVSRAPAPLNLLFMKSGDDFVVLVKAKTPINPNMGDERFVHHAFRIDIGKYEESRAFLVEKGVHIVHEEERVDGVFRGKQAHFHDPDRNVLEIIALAGIGP
jgi:catechol 2,3-dioxygenase-like lactoylglutathione lyase family enzyme